MGTNLDGIDEKVKYENAWAQLRIMRRRYWLVFAAYIPWMFLIMLTLKKDLYVIIGFFLHAAVTGYFANQIMKFMCPRCGCTFYQCQRYHNSFTKSCLNCGLKANTYPAELTGNRS